jgi:hypothetical protein
MTVTYCGSDYALTRRFAVRPLPQGPQGEGCFLMLTALSHGSPSHRLRRIERG